MAKLSDLIKKRTPKAKAEPKAKKRPKAGRPTHTEVIAAGKRPADLVNAQQAMAAEFYLRGDTKTDAYRKAYRCSPEAAAWNHQKIFTMPTVRDYIALRIKARAEQNKLVEQRVLNEWQDLLNVALPDVLDIGDCGNIRMKHFNQMTDAEKRSIKKLKIKQTVLKKISGKKEKGDEVEEEEGVTLALVEQEIQIESYSRVDVLRAVGEHLGMFAESEEANARGVTKAILDRVQRVREQREKEQVGRVIDGKMDSK